MLVGEPGETEILIAAARDGDGQALGQLLESYRNYLMLLAQVRIGQKLQTKVDPADVVQETFLRASVGFKTFRGQNETELLAWLRKILASRLCDLRRRFCGAASAAPTAAMSRRKSGCKRIWTIPRRLPVR